MEQVPMEVVVSIITGMIGIATLMIGALVKYLFGRMKDLEKQIAEERKNCEEDRKTLNQVVSEVNTLQKLSVTVTVISDLNGIILSANQALEIVFGWEPAEVIGQPVETLMAAGSLERHHHAITARKNQIEGGDRSRYMTRVNEGVAQDSHGRQFAVSVDVDYCIYGEQDAFRADIRRLG